MLYFKIKSVFNRKDIFIKILDVLSKIWNIFLKIDKLALSFLRVFTLQYNVVVIYSHKESNLVSFYAPLNLYSLIQASLAKISFNIEKLLIVLERKFTYHERYSIGRHRISWTKLWIIGKNNAILIEIKAREEINIYAHNTES